MIEIIKFDHQGRGIGTINNKIIFIPNTIPGEIIEYKIVKEKKNYIEGQVTKIIKKSDKRIEPICPYFNICGGCHLLHLTYNNQLKYKQEKIENIIHKYTDKNIQIQKIIKCDNIYNYRNKATLHINNKIGFYKQNTNEIIDINYCYLLDDKINNLLKELKTLKLEKDEIIIRSNNINTLIYNQNKNNNLNNIKTDNIISQNETIKGNGYLITPINQLKYIISPTSFFQVNTQQTKILYEKIKEMAQLKKEDNLLDLYCGTGTIGLYLSKYCNTVLGIEINKDAINDAKKNKILNNIKNIEFIAEDAKKIIKKMKYKPNIIIVDPPRSGLFKGMINDLIKFNAQKIIYVSCDPITLSRDLKELSNYYKIQEVQPIDMFPNTYHVETIVLLQKM